MKSIRIVSFLVLLLSINTGHTAHPYYPSKFQTLLAQQKLKGEGLKKSLFYILASKHRHIPGKADIIDNSCNVSRTKGCYSHKVLDYREARRYLFGSIHLNKDESGHYVTDVYCQKKISGRKSGVGPMRVPNPNLINCEHTWPQSKFTTRFDKRKQLSDLHHLFPTDMPTNSVRGNIEFGQIAYEKRSPRNCNGSYVGKVHNEIGQTYFEPPNSHKGALARAMFYFSVRYKIKISNIQERFLKMWHRKYPVTREEFQRNHKVFLIQNNRNPFVDFPHLVNLINDF